jgi:hypothetical protein
MSEVEEAAVLDDAHPRLPSREQFLQIFAAAGILLEVD